MACLDADCGRHQGTGDRPTSTRPSPTRGARLERGALTSGHRRRSEQRCGYIDHLESHQADLVEQRVKAQILAKQGKRTEAVASAEQRRRSARVTRSSKVLKDPGSPRRSPTGRSPLRSSAADRGRPPRPMSRAVPAAPFRGSVPAGFSRPILAGRAPPSSPRTSASRDDRCAPSSAPRGRSARRWRTRSRAQTRA